MTCKLQLAPIDRLSNYKLFVVFKQFRTSKLLSQKFGLGRKFVLQSFYCEVGEQRVGAQILSDSEEVLRRLDTVRYWKKLWPVRRNELF